MELTARDQEILRATILYYIKSASPVGSRTLTKLTDLGLSPATIRNVMADLEESGFLSQPHTSAGRIPTEKAYRFYVDALLGLSPHPAEDSEFARLRLSPSEDIKETLHEASRLLSLLSRYAGVVMTPRASILQFARVELIRLGERHLLVIFVSTDGSLHNRMVEVDEEWSPDQLRQVSSELNQRFAGQDLATIRATLLDEMREQKRRYDQLMRQIVQAAELSKDRSEDVYVEGKANILEAPEFADVDKMKTLFKTFEEKYRIVTLIDKSLETDGVHVFIGSENSVLGIPDLSLVVANYRCGGQPAYGTVGVLGPIRMEYDRVIPLVDRVATILGNLFDEHTRSLRVPS